VVLAFTGTKRVDLSLDAFRVHADPVIPSRKERETRQETRRYAKAIRALREEKGLKQTEVAELSEREVRRLESGDHMPQYRSLEKLARAHEMGRRRVPRRTCMAVVRRSACERIVRDHCSARRPQQVQT